MYLDGFFCSARDSHCQLLARLRWVRGNINAVNVHRVGVMS